MPGRDSVIAIKTQNANRTRNLFGSLYAPQWKNVNSGLTMLWMDQTYWGFDVSATNAIYDFDRPKKRGVLVPRATMALNGENLLSYGRAICFTGLAKTLRTVPRPT